MVDGYNKNSDNKKAYTDNLNAEELQTIEELWCSSREIEDVSGLEKITSLKNLHIKSNSLTNLNVSKLSDLMYLDVSYNQLSSLDLSKNTKLNKLNLSENNLTILNLEYIEILKELNISNNKVDGIKFGNVSSLVSLYLSNNNLGSLDVSNALNLTSLNISNNQLTSLDLSKNTKLVSININDNPYGKDLIPMFAGNLVDSYAVVLPSHIASKVNYSTLYHLDDNGKNPVTGLWYELRDNKLFVDMWGDWVIRLIGENPAYTEKVSVGVVDIDSSVYEVDKEKYFIDVGIDTDVEVKNNIEVKNGNIDIEDNYLVVKYENTEVKKFKLERTEYTSEVCDLNNDYIYVGNDTDEEIRSSIILDVDGFVKEINNNTLVIKYNNEIIDSYDLVRVTSDKYNLDNYGIFGIDGDYVKSNLNVINGTLETVKNVEGILLSINILHDGKVISNIPVHNISSDKYVITDEYIFTGFDGINISDIKTDSYVSVDIEDSKLRIKYYNDVVGEIELFYLNKKSNMFEVNEKANVIVFKNDITYQKFMDECFELGNSNMSVRLVDQNDNEVESLENNYKFEVFYNSKLLKTYTIVVRGDDLVYTEDAEVVTVSYNEDILKNLRLNDSFYNVRNLFETSGIVSVYDKYKTNLSMDAKIKTGDYFTVDFTEYKHFIYLSVLGDVDGSGDITTNDVSKSYNILRGKEKVSEVYYLATDINKDDKLKINDIAKLHQYVKGKISNLED